MLQRQLGQIVGRSGRFQLETGAIKHFTADEILTEDRLVPLMVGAQPFQLGLGLPQLQSALVGIQSGQRVTGFDGIAFFDQQGLDDPAHARNHIGFGLGLQRRTASPCGGDGSELGGGDLNRNSRLFGGILAIVTVFRCRCAAGTEQR